MMKIVKDSFLHGKTIELTDLSLNSNNTPIAMVLLFTDGTAAYIDHGEVSEIDVNVPEIKQRFADLRTKHAEMKAEKPKKKKKSKS